MEKTSRYERVRKLAVGGMCEIDLVYDRHVAGAQRAVVIKSLAKSLVAQPEILRMFQHEAWVLATASHPVLPTVHAFWQGRDTWHLAMEYVRGRELGALGAMPVAYAVCAIAQALEGLEAAHTLTNAKGEPLRVVHRDVTPSNVMVADSGAVKLVDFGIATSAELPDTKHGSMRGTSGYMSPEAVRGDLVVDHRADVFAAGVVLHEALTGERLFGGNILAAMHAVTEGEIAAPSTRAAVPAWMDAVVMRALERDPSKRFGSAGEMARAMETGARENGGLVSRWMLAEWLTSVR